MRLQHALLLLAMATAGVGSVGIQVSLSAENVATCEVAVNKRTLDIVILLHHESRRAIDLAELRTAKRLYDATGREQPEIERRLEKMAEQLVALNERALTVNEDLRLLLERGCESERDAWILWSLLLTILTAALSCLGLWLGLRVRPDAEAETSPPDHSPGDTAG